MVDIEGSFSNLTSKVEVFLSNEPSGHDVFHAIRVFKLAKYIQSADGGDLLTIGCAALVHDILRPWEKKTGKPHFGPEALEIIKTVLQEADIPTSNVPAILEVVGLHDTYDWSEKMKDKSVELQVVQDADNLDAIGAIGIARTFAFGGAHGLSMYNPGENLSFDKDFVDDPTLHRTTTIAHFYEKLLKLKDNMNTKTGKAIAEKRHKLMTDFLADFFEEWDVKL